MQKHCFDRLSAEIVLRARQSLVDGAYIGTVL